MAKSKRRSSGRSSGAATSQDWVVQPGTPVYGADDRKLGEVTDIRDGRLIVHKGGLFPKDHHVPFSAIAGHTDARIDLSVTAGQAASQEWTATGSAAERAQDRRAEPTGEPVAVSRDDAPSTAPVEGFDPMLIPVVEERLEATRHTVERGAVQILTTVSEHEETLAVGVTEERIHIERIPVDRLATAADLSITRDVLEVPVYGEEIDLSRRARVVEEIEISKEGVQETREVSGTVRREDVAVVDAAARQDLTAHDAMGQQTLTPDRTGR